MRAADSGPRLSNAADPVRATAGKQRARRGAPPSLEAQFLSMAEAIRGAQDKHELDDDGCGTDSAPVAAAASNAVS
ncbi:hypothetical protein MTO96_002753 [Rhipicephalus appendiculatus]